MKIQLILTTLALGSVAAFAQERAASFDSVAAKAALSKEVATTPGKFFTKSVGGDPVAKRFYTKDAVVITRQSGATEEHPYVAVPLLFRVNTDELLDTVSRQNVVRLAQMLKDMGTQNCTFAIEGHASAEGDARRNLDLSKLRAAKIQSLLREQGVAAGELARVEGLGSEHAQFKDPRIASESQLQQDRRVLVVKER